jgi:adenylyltransferase/sulfurtransferase
LISGAAIRFEGQLAVFDPSRPASPCYACLYPEDAEGLDNCRGNGVLAPVVGVIGSLMAAEAIKLLTGMGEPATGHMLLYDALRCAWRRIRLKRDPTCRVCGAPEAGLSGRSAGGG